MRTQLGAEKARKPFFHICTWNILEKMTPEILKAMYVKFQRHLDIENTWNFLLRFQKKKKNVTSFGIVFSLN